MTDEMAKQRIRLTQTVKKGGCAAKVAAAELRKILATVPFPKAPAQLMVDGRDFDDAAIYRISDTVAMVQTIDFFTPILDSPFDFGRVAAANAISDVYAMGGKPVTALAVLAFPVGSLDNETISEVLKGACEVIGKSGAALAGGHSIDDETLKFGLSVTGLVHPDRVWKNTGARAGDTLILTKGLGTGTLTAALKREAITEEEIRPAIESMAKLNNVIDELGDDLCSYVHAATDITGFGFSGHGMQMAKASAVTFEINMASLPRLLRAEEFLEKEFLTKAHRTNREYTLNAIDVGSISSLDQLLLHDPQTSGGLLLSVDSAQATELVQKLRHEFPATTIVGRVLPKRAHFLEIR
jgi:selenide,water dikinase